MFERFTTAARGVALAAQGEAARLSHHYVGTEHVLLGVLSPEFADEAAARVLVAVGLDRDYVRSETLRLVGPGTPLEGRLGEDEAASLQAIGIDLDAVRSRVESAFGEGVLDQAHRDPPAGRLPFTPRAKKSLELALREASRLHHRRLGPDHILLGLIREGHGVAAQIVLSKAPLDVVRERLLAELDAAA